MLELEFIRRQWPRVYCVLCLVRQFSLGVVPDERISVFVGRILRVLKAFDTDEKLNDLTYPAFLGLVEDIDFYGRGGVARQFKALISATRSIQAMQQVVWDMHRFVLTEDGQDVKKKAECIEAARTQEERYRCSRHRYLESSTVLGQFVLNATEYFLRLELNKRSTLFYRVIEFVGRDRIFFNTSVEAKFKVLNMGSKPFLEDETQSTHSRFAKLMEGGDIGRIIELSDRMVVQDPGMDHVGQHMLLSLVYSMMGLPETSLEHIQEAMKIGMFMNMEPVDLELTQCMITLIKNFPELENMSKLGTYDELWRHACSAALKSTDEGAKYLMMLRSIIYGLENYESPVTVLEKAALVSLKRPMIQPEPFALIGESYATLARMWSQYGRGRMARLHYDIAIKLMRMDLEKAPKQSMMASIDSLGRALVDRAWMLSSGSVELQMFMDIDPDQLDNVLASRAWFKYRWMLEALKAVKEGDTSTATNLIELLRSQGSLEFGLKQYITMLQIWLFRVKGELYMAHDAASEGCRALQDSRFGEEHKLAYEIERLAVRIELLREPVLIDAADLESNIGVLEGQARRLYHAPLSHAILILSANLKRKTGRAHEAIKIIHEANPSILESLSTKNIHDASITLAQAALGALAEASDLSLARDNLRIRMKAITVQEDSPHMRAQAAHWLTEVTSKLHDTFGWSSSDDGGDCSEDQTPQRRDSKRAYSPEQLPVKKLRTPK